MQNYARAMAGMGLLIGALTLSAALAGARIPAAQQEGGGPAGTGEDAVPVALIELPAEWSSAAGTGIWETAYRAGPEGKGSAPFAESGTEEAGTALSAELGTKETGAGSTAGPEEAGIVPDPVESGAPEHGESGVPAPVEHDDPERGN